MESLLTLGFLHRRPLEQGLMKDVCIPEVNDGSTLQEVPSRPAPGEENAWLTSGHGIPKHNQKRCWDRRGRLGGMGRVEGKQPDCFRRSWPSTGPPWSPWNEAVPGKLP